MAGEITSVGSVKYMGELNLASGTWSDHRPTSFGPDVAWDNGLFDTGFFSGATDRERLDWGDVATGTVVNGFQLAYATDSTVPIDIIVAFYDSENGVNTPGAEVLFVMEFLDLEGSASGLFEAFAYDIDLEGGGEFTIDGADLDGDGLSDFGYGYHTTSGGLGTATGPLLSSPEGLGSGVGAPGIEDFYDRYAPLGKHAGSAYVSTVDVSPAGGNPFTQYHMILYTPEPSALAVLGLGTLIMIRRSRSR